MITLKPSPNAPNVLTFDGEVLEEFYGRESQRVHILHITGIQLNTDGKGNHELIVKTVVGNIPHHTVEEKSYAKATELVTAVQAAMTSFKL